MPKKMSNLQMKTSKDREQVQESGRDQGSLPSDALLSSTDVGVTDTRKKEDGAKEKRPHPAVPVDCGWAWVIMIAQFVITLMILGYVRALSIFFLEFIDLFHMSVSMTSLIFGLMSIFTAIGNIVATYVLMPRMDTRKIVLLGSCVCGAATALSSLATSAAFIMVTHSIIGLSYSLMYVPSITLLSYYFDKHRSLAVAVASTGISISGLIFPPLTHFFITTFGARGALLLIAGMKLQTIVAACLLRPVASDPVHQVTTAKEVPSSGNSQLGTVDTEGVDHGTLVDSVGINHRAHHHSSHDTAVSMKTRTRSLSSLRNPEQPMDVVQRSKWSGNFPLSTSLPTPNSNLSNSAEYIYRDMPSDKDQHDKNDNNILASRDHVCPDLYNPESPLLIPTITTDNNTPNTGATTTTNTIATTTTTTHGEYEKSGSGKNLYSHGIVKNNVSVFSAPTGQPTMLYESNLTLQSLSVPVLPRPSSTALSTAAHQGYDDCSKKGTSWMWLRFQRLRQVVRSLDMSLFKNWLFRLILFYLPLGLSEGLVAFYFPSLGVDRGLSREDATLLMTVVGGVDLVSRLCVGYLADLNVVKRTHLVSGSLIILGLVTQFARFYDSFGLLAMLAVIYGLCGGVCHSLMVVVIIDLVGMTVLSEAVSLALLLNFFAMSINHPIIGVLADLTGSFAVPFNYIGACLLSSATILLMEPFARKLEAKRVSK